MAKGIFVGLATIDVVYSVDEFPASDSKVVARSQDLYVGGPATNASILFAHLGGKAVLVTAVGRHALTHTLHEEFKQYSIELSDIHPEFAEAPVVSSISIDKAGRRNVISANASRMAVPAVRADEAMLQGAGVLLVDGHFMPACQAWAKAARAHGMRTVLDGGSWKDGTEELLGSIDCAICSADFKPPGCSTPEQIIADIPAGLYVTGLMGFGVNVVTGDYSRGATGLWIERGALTYAVEEVTIAGNLAEMLMNVTAIGNDLEFRGAVASPTLRIDGMTIAGA